MSKRRSIISFHTKDAQRRPPNLAETLEDGQPDNGDESAGAGPFSLAHELAAALLPEPSVGSRLLAEEFGIEVEENVPDIEEEGEMRDTNDYSGEVSTEHSAWATPNVDSRSRSPSIDGTAQVGGYLAVNGHKPKHIPTSTPDPDPALSFQSRPSPKEENLLDDLQREIASMDTFIKQLRRIDAMPSRRSSLSPSRSTFLSSSTSSAHEPPLEQAASRMIRRLNDTTREREEQVRELREMEKEFRKISTEVGGVDRLGNVDALQSMAELLDDLNSLKVSGFSSTSTRNSWSASKSAGLADVDEEQENVQDLEVVDEPGDFRDPDSAKDDPSLQPVPITGPPDPTNLIPHFANSRMVTQSVVNSLSIIVEHSQVNTATTGDAGRKIRALKNKIGAWKAELEGAERSRERIKKWEMGQLDDGSPNFFHEIVPGTKTYRRVRDDARSIVHEHLSGFAMVLNEASSRAAEIMAS
jgi:hypothetical protein